MALNRFLLLRDHHIVRHGQLWLHRWRDEDLHNAMKPEVREWLREYGGRYDLTAAIIKAVVHNHRKEYSRTTYALRIYVEFDDPDKLMLFKLTF